MSDSDHLYQTTETAVSQGSDLNECPRLSQDRHPQLWFHDGTVILATPETLFKVYKGILSSNSSVFRDLFSLPVANANAPTSDTLDGVDVIQMPDHHEDLATFLLATHFISSVPLSCVFRHVLINVLV